MKNVVLSIVLLGITLITKAQDETVNGKLTVNGHIYGQYLHTTDNNATGALFTYPANQNLYLGAGKDQNGNKNEIILYNLSCDGGCNVPKIQLLTDQVYTTGNFYQKISGTPSNWLYLIKSSNQNSGFWANNGNPAVYLRNTNGDLNVVLRPDGNSYLNGGNLGIGTTNIGSWKLAVNGKIRAKEIKVETGWSDFVFYDDYKLPTLQEVEKHIEEKGHLKDIPSAKEVKENGILLGEMNSKLLQKIEELTLYTIEQEKQLDKQSEEIAELKILVKKLLEIKK
ncbi:hypothetical protein J8L88_16825 [Aquimarina sp. MMG015]|uniref:hypothetical protein n=1 Tax=Aquimarina sp. MMG015 TaxID=2822689 RepID=UPI001B3A4859|nr:hypothetical protein [Aquimarina sp. MMG015]MBQ4804527.1 hypothetical protein [Aquimarina sp. MMG015]